MRSLQLKTYSNKKRKMKMKTSGKQLQKVPSKNINKNYPNFQNELSD